VAATAGIALQLVALCRGIKKGTRILGSGRQRCAVADCMDRTGFSGPRETLVAFAIAPPASGRRMVALRATTLLLSARRRPVPLGWRAPWPAVRHPPGSDCGAKRLIRGREALIQDSGSRTAGALDLWLAPAARRRAAWARLAARSDGGCIPRCAALVAAETDSAVRGSRRGGEGRDARTPAERHDSTLNWRAASEENHGSRRALAPDPPGLSVEALRSAHARGCEQGLERHR